MTGDHIGDIRMPDEPAGGKPPVRVDDLGAHLANRRPDGSSKGSEKSGKGQGSERRAQSRMVKATGVGHPLERIRSIAKAPYPHSTTLLLEGEPRSVRSDHLYVVSLLGDAESDSGDKGAGGITRVPRIVVSHRENAELIDRRHPGTSRHKAQPHDRAPGGRARLRPPVGPLAAGRDRPGG